MTVKFAVVQHALRPTPAQDLEALVLAVAHAAAQGAGVVFLPAITSVYDGPLYDDLFRRTSEVAPGIEIVPARDDHKPGRLAVEMIESLGSTVVLVGDDAIDLEALERCAAARLGVLVLAPGAESELQSQAVLELAIALSTSVASLVIVAETHGAELGEPGHGGSAVVHLGQMLAEAIDDEGLLLAEVVGPLGPPEVPEAMPEVPSVLLQRLGAHRGRKLDVAYPADLS